MEQRRTVLYVLQVTRTLSADHRLLLFGCRMYGFRLEWKTRIGKNIKSVKIPAGAGRRPSQNSPEPGQVCFMPHYDLELCPYLICLTIYATQERFGCFPCKRTMKLDPVT